MASKVQYTVQPAHTLDLVGLQKSAPYWNSIVEPILEFLIEASIDWSPALELHSGSPHWENHIGAAVEQGPHRNSNMALMHGGAEEGSRHDP